MPKAFDKTPSKIQYPPGCKEISDELGRDELLKRLKVWSSIDQWWAGTRAGMNCLRGSRYGVLLISDELGRDELRGLKVWSSIDQWWAGQGWTAQEGQGMEFYWSVMSWAGMNCLRGSWYGVLLISDELGRDELLKRVMVWSSIDQWWAGQGWNQGAQGMEFYWSVMSWAGMNCSRGSW